MKMLSRTLLVCSLVVCAVAQEESRLVYTSQGPVRGYKGSDDIFVFYNIPYATAPTGLDKFKAPLPPSKWSEPLEAVNRGIICPQTGTDIYVSSRNITMQEDCLVANIYVPDTDARKLPVVVYVHGGAYQSGFGDGVKPINLIKSENMIVVTFNYRLGVHGFLCLGTHDAPGNAGMKDQVALLRWVHKNIAKFGGNPHDVTLTGCSAGSHAADLLMLSKTTNGLINKVILNSGVSLNPSAVQVNPLKTAKEYAELLNFTNVEEDIFALAEFYKTAPLESLLTDFHMSKKDSDMMFVPCVERYVGVEMFLDEAPIHTLKRGNYKRLPMIYGFTNMEGLLRYPNFEEWKDDMNENFSDYLPVDLEFDSEDEKVAVAQMVKEFYFGNQSVGDDTVSSFVDFFTDVTFTYGTLWTVKLHVENGRHAYLYEYSFANDDDMMIPNLCGAGHCAQEAALFDGNGVGTFDEENISEKYKNMKQIIRELWSNFIRTGNPVANNSSLPIWIPAGVNSSPHLSLGDTVEIRGPLLEERARFWEDIYSKYYNVPRSPFSSALKPIHHQHTN